MAVNAGLRELHRKRGVLSGALPGSHYAASRWCSEAKQGIHLKQQLKDKLIEYTQYISKEEQRKRFLQRIDAPDKLWKVS
jgi:hypothetical protein